MVPSHVRTLIVFRYLDSLLFRHAALDQVMPLQGVYYRSACSRLYPGPTICRRKFMAQLDGLLDFLLHEQEVILCRSLYICYD